MGKENEKLISIIIPVYNSEQYLRECLESVINNTYKMTEIICVDDGSTDNSSRIIKEFQKDYNNIVLLTQDNAGVSAARNLGKQHAHGDYIAFIDSDDLVADCYLQNLLDACERENADIAVCRFNKTRLPDSVRFKNEYNILNQKEYYMSKHARIYVITKLYKRTVIDDVFFDNQIRYAEDIAFNMSILCRSISLGNELKCIVFDDEMYYYRQNEQSLTHNYRKEDWLPFCNNMKEKSECSDNNIVRNLYGYEALKKYLVTWYDAYLQKDYETAAFSERNLKRLRKLVGFTRDYMEIADYLSLKLFSLFPWLYAKFRKLNDSKGLIRH